MYDDESISREDVVSEGKKNMNKRVKRTTPTHGPPTTRPVEIPRRGMTCVLLFYNTVEDKEYAARSK
jgi:hypothetical protein